jgi:hypothetical protein
MVLSTTRCGTGAGGLQPMPYSITNPKTKAEPDRRNFNLPAQIIEQTTLKNL